MILEEISFRIHSRISTESFFPVDHFDCHVTLRVEQDFLPSGHTSKHYQYIEK